MKSIEQKTDDFVAKYGDSSEKNAKKKLDIWKSVQSLCSIVIPLLVTIVIGCFPHIFTKKPFIMVGGQAFVWILGYLFLQKRVTKYERISCTLLERTLIEDEKARDIDRLVDNYTATLNGVSDEVLKGKDRKEVYGVVHEYMCDMIKPRMSKTRSFRVNIYRRWNGEAKLIWYNRITGRSILPAILDTKLIKKGEGSSYLQDYIFAEAKNSDEGKTVYFGKKDIPDSIKQGNKQMAFYLGRGIDYKWKADVIGYYIEYVGYGGPEKIAEGVCTNIICDIINPLIDILLLIDCHYGGEFSAEEKNE